MRIQLFTLFLICLEERFFHVLIQPNSEDLNDEADWNTPCICPVIDTEGF
jgi:hypothetical protein